MNIKKKCRIYNSEDVYPVFGKSPDPDVSTVWYHAYNRSEAGAIALNGEISNPEMIAGASGGGYICVETNRKTGKERILYFMLLLSDAKDGSRRFMIRFPKGDVLAADAMHIWSEEVIRNGYVVLQESRKDLTPENILVDGFHDFEVVRPDRYFGQKILPENSGSLSVERELAENNGWNLMSDTKVMRTKAVVMSAAERMQYARVWAKAAGRKCFLMPGDLNGPIGQIQFCLTDEESEVILGVLSTKKSAA